MHVDLESEVLCDNFNSGDFLIFWFVRLAPSIGSSDLSVVVCKHEGALEHVPLDFYR